MEFLVSGIIYLIFFLIVAELGFLLLLVAKGQEVSAKKTFDIDSVLIHYLSDKPIDQLEISSCRVLRQRLLVFANDVNGKSLEKLSQFYKALKLYKGDLADLCSSDPYIVSQALARCRKFEIALPSATKRSLLSHGNQRVSMYTLKHIVDTEHGDSKYWLKIYMQHRTAQKDKVVELIGGSQSAGVRISNSELMLEPKLAAL